MRRLIFASIVGVLPWFAQAQIMPATAENALPPVYSPDLANLLQSNRRPDLGNSAEAAQVMPVFRSPDGRLLALVALSNTGASAPLRPASPAIGAPTDWRLVDITGAVAGSIGLRLGENANYSLNAALGERLLTSPNNVANLEVSCLPGANSSAGLPCWAALANGGAANPIASAYNASLGAAWSNSSSFGLDISYSLSWLNGIDSTLPRSASAADLFTPVTADPVAAALPSLILPGTVLYTSGMSSSLATHAHWWPSLEDSVDIGASLSRIQLSAFGAALSSNFNEAALSFGLSHGALSGVLIGHVLSPADASSGSQRWSAIDLGVSWRTPWQGQISIGTQNLWSSGPPPLSLSPAARDPEPTQARMPYVQYHQDL